jgi:hypothetical protein
MKQYAVIHGVAGLHEGYSETTCEFFPKRSFAEKHMKQLIATFREDETCVHINDIQGDFLDASVIGGADLSMTRWWEDYHASVPAEFDHDDYMESRSDDVWVEVLRIIELDMSNRDANTESCWLTWDQLECRPAWDYTPLCMSLVARVTSDVMDTTSDDHPTQALHNLAQLGDFVSAVYYRNHAIIDVDDYVMHAFRIPKPKNSDSYDAQ